jgi:hypothetical protein
MRPANIELQIEELMLHGFAPGDGHSIGESVGRELARLFAEDGVPQSLARASEVGYLDGGRFEMESGLAAEAVGARLARAIHRELGA